jgi:ATP-dependent Lhr-like helicase
MPGFANVPAATLAAVIDHMVTATLLVSDNGLLSIGGEGEDSYGRKNFMALLSCFTSPPLFRVLHGQREIGLIDQISFVLRNNEKPVILLAGRGWQVSHLDWDARIAYVVPTELKGRSQWLGSSPALSFELCQAIRQVISMDGHQPQWSRRACDAIDEVRFDMPWCHAGNTTIILSGPGACAWWTFAGLRANATFAEAFTALGIKAAADNFSVNVNTEVNELQATLMDQVLASAPGLWPASLGTKALDNLKFSDCLPPALAQEMLRARLSAVSNVQRVLEERVSFTS